ncbi:MAG: FAD-dependent oxidoreductase, partial [Steroidobacteraceae bacterium]|nr:FAD-dependent oxidoreductase [Steroidobacteraceae bacterium]MDW8259499.1 FAD-dependent oxidoreductase [Gammaproteobacteria bacterium]
MNSEQTISDILPPSAAAFVAHAPVIVVGGGGCGLTAALAAKERGAEVLVLEREPQALGTTAMSTGLIPGAGTRAQRERGIDDTPERFAEDILKKARYQTDAALVHALARESATTVDWLIERHSVPLTLVETFQYPGHSVKRMHGTPNRTGAELMAALAAAIGREQIDVATSATVESLFADASGRIAGVRVRRPDAATEDLSCDALVLACGGFAGNSALVERFLPEITGATLFGHRGNQGDAIRWGEALGAAIRDIHAYQGHGGLAAGWGIPILWPVIMEGGFQVNVHGARFSNEALGYSEQAVQVLAQPGRVAWTIYDERLHRLMLEFDDYRHAVEARAILTAPTVAELAQRAGIDAAGLEQTVTAVAAQLRTGSVDRWGRRFADRPPLAAPFYAVKVTGALFHTQGGLAVNAQAQVLREDGRLLPNLFAGGGAARGVSGPSCWGYIAGNGLLTATTLGRLAGQS